MSNFTRTPIAPDYADEVTNISLSRELWQPDRNEQLAAVEILLASPLPYETRVVIRELEQQIVMRTPAFETEREQKDQAAA